MKKKFRYKHKENTTDKTNKQVDHEQNYIPQVNETKSSLGLPKESKQGNQRQFNPQTDPTRDEGATAKTSTGLNSHHTLYTDIPAVNFISAPSAKPKRLLHIFLVALLAVAICLGVFWGHHAWHQAHSLNEPPLLLQTSPHTSHLDSIQVRMPTPSPHTENVVKSKVSQQFDTQNHAFEPG